MKKISFKLATYNVQGMHKQNIFANIASMKKQGVKIFCLQEVPNSEKQSLRRTVKAVLGKGWTCEFFLNETNPLDLGLAIFWDTRVMRALSVQQIVLPKLEKCTRFEKFIVKVTGITTQFFERKALVGTFAIGKQVIRIVNVHLDWQGGFNHRKNQLSFLVNTLNSIQKVSSEIICGDFNTIIDLRSVAKKRKHIQALFGLGFFEATLHIPWTMDMQRSFDANRKFLYNILKKLHITFHQKLDYIWGKGIEVLETDILELEGSDHVPVIATLGVRTSNE